MAAITTYLGYVLVCRVLAMIAAIFPVSAYRTSTSVVSTPIIIIIRHRISSRVQTRFLPRDESHSGMKSPARPSLFFGNTGIINLRRGTDNKKFPRRRNQGSIEHFVEEKASRNKIPRLTAWIKGERLVF